jgi:zinc transporter
MRKANSPLSADRLTPLAAVDVLADGTVRGVGEGWPAAAPGAGAAWRWLHCDRTAPGFAAWSHDHLPGPARAGMLEAQARPRCDMVEDGGAAGLVLNLSAVNLNKDQDPEDMVSIRLWITPALVVSTRYRRMFLIEELLAEMKEGRGPRSTAGFVLRLADRIVRRIEDIAREREEALDRIEELLLDNRPDRLGAGEQEMARIMRSVIKLRRHVGPQREALARMAGSEAGFLTKAERFGFRELANRLARSAELLDALRERLASLRSHVDSLHAAQMGRNSFALSVVAVIFLPLSFLTGLFGVNLAGIPGADWPWAFGALSLTTVLIAAGLWLFFHWKRWF